MKNIADLYFCTLIIKKPSNELLTNCKKKEVRFGCVFLCISHALAVFHRLRGGGGMVGLVSIILFSKINK